jgi:WD40 repeat protein
MVFDTQTGREVFTLTGHRQRVSALCFNPEGSRLISGEAARGNNIKIWNMSSGWEAGSLAGGEGEGIYCLSVSADGTFFVSVAGMNQDGGTYSGIYNVWGGAN